MDSFLDVAQSAKLLLDPIDHVNAVIDTEPHPERRQWQRTDIESHAFPGHERIGQEIGRGETEQQDEYGANRAVIQQDA